MSTNMREKGISLLLRTESNGSLVCLPRKQASQGQALFVVRLTRERGKLAGEG